MPDKLTDNPVTTPPVMVTPADAGPALRWGFDSALAQGARSITCVATRFDQPWPWDDVGLLAALVPWLRQPQRSLVLLAADYQHMAQRFPRFAQWRRPWVHAVQAWECPPEAVQALPAMALFDNQRVSVQLLDAETGRGRAALEVRHRLLLAQQTDAILQRSEAAWPAKTLGL